MLILCSSKLSFFTWSQRQHLPLLRESNVTWLWPPSLCWCSEFFLFYSLFIINYTSIIIQFPNIASFFNSLLPWSLIWRGWFDERRFRPGLASKPWVSPSFLYYIQLFFLKLHSTDMESFFYNTQMSSFFFSSSQLALKVVRSCEVDTSTHLGSLIPFISGLLFIAGYAYEPQGC